MATKASKTAAPAKPAASTPPAAKKLDRHPLSEKFSLPTTEAERAALADDIETNGQHQEIVLYEGKVLDGWERYLGCMAKGVTPKYKTYEGDNPAAVAFGLNAIRRKLNSVQKALFGAKYLVHMQSEGHAVTQQQVAKASCCSLQRLNEIAQLIRASDDNSKAAKCLSTLNTNPDVTAAMLQDMLIDAGIINPNAKAKPAASADTDLDDDLGDDDDGDHDSDGAVDMLGGADIDDLLDDDDGDDDILGERKAPTPQGDKGKGKRVGTDKHPRETPASLVSKHFRALTENERVDFVQFAWAMLRPAIEQCVSQKRVQWPALGVDKDAGTAALANAAAALAASVTGKAKASAAGKAAKPASKAASAPAAKPATVAAGKPAKAASKPAKPATVAAAKGKARA